MRYERTMIVRRIARPMLAAGFVLKGIDHVRHPSPRVETVRPLVNRLAGHTPVPDDPELLVRVNGAVMAGAGALLATGRAPRLAAGLLAVNLVPTILTDNDFWREPDLEERTRKRRELLSNIGLLGGVLLACVDTAGQPGLAWRSQRAAKDAQRLARHARKSVHKEAELARARMEAALPLP